jgi:hypothetical protein
MGLGEMLLDDQLEKMAAGATKAGKKLTPDDLDRALGSPPFPSAGPASGSHDGTVPPIPADLAAATLSKPELKYKATDNELWREYRYWDAQGVYRAYRINNPIRMFYYSGCTTHRVLDAEGLVHIVPAVSQGGCVMVYRPRAADVPVLG